MACANILFIDDDRRTYARIMTLCHDRATFLVIRRRLEPPTAIMPEFAHRALSMTIFTMSGFIQR